MVNIPLIAVSILILFNDSLPSPRKEFLSLDQGMYLAISLMLDSINAELYEAVAIFPPLYKVIAP